MAKRRKTERNVSSVAGRHLPGERGGQADAELEEPRSDPRCPRCSERDAEVISLFGTQAMTLQYRCRRCGTLFEAVKYEE